jgi:type I restriction enzyme M protein
MSEKISLQQLETFLLDAADILRGDLDASEFKDYIFSIMFIKRISDSFDEERENVINKFIKKGKNKDKAIELADDPVQYNAFYIPKKSHWSHLQNLKHDIGSELNKAVELIEENNPTLEGVLVAIDFNKKDKISDTKLRDLISHFNKYKLRNVDFENADIMGSAYEYLIKMFADSAGKKGGEFYTPSEVVSLIVNLIKPKKRMRIYDPTCGSGGMLIQSRNYLLQNGEDPRNISLYGQETNLSTWAICKLNMFLHYVFNADIKKGNTLTEPKHTKDGEIMTFDRVIANPPFSLKKWGKKKADNDKYGRFIYGTPPNDYGELAFLQHMISSLNSDGVLGVVMPHGILFRGSSEKTIREGLIKDDLIEAIIALPPNLFYGTSIAATIIIINKKKLKDRKGKIIFINSEFEYEERANKNFLADDNIKKILNLFDNFQNLTIPKSSEKYNRNFSKVISNEEIIKNDYNMNVKRYVDASPPDEFFDAFGIINSGIPTQEIEDDYIKETIDGIDINKILDKKEKKYFVFKKEIKNKFDINRILKTSNKKGLMIIQRWWEKYRFPLNELKVDCNNSEISLRENLKKIKYEI